MNLTDQQKKVLSFIKEYHRKNSYSPTRSEISEHFGWSGPNAAECHLIPLSRKGAIKLVPSIGRGIVLLKQ